MISICLKSNYLQSLKLIEKYLDSETLPEIYYSIKKFKYYNNLIIHYKGPSVENFYSTISNTIANYFVSHYEKLILRQQLDFDFFYFSEDEKFNITDVCIELLNTPIIFDKKISSIRECLFNYFLDCSVCNLEGFANFRLSNYRNLINHTLESAISEYILKKEYLEYVNILHEYVSLEIPQTNYVHLVYSSNCKLLLDQYGTVLANTSNSHVYLSDISFSSNDYILNSILSYLPKEIYVHIENTEDNFISFLKLIFGDRFHISKDFDLYSKQIEDN